MVEIYLIAQIRVYITEAKFIAPSGDIGSKCLKGHVISFPHDGPAAAAARLKLPPSFPWIEEVLDLVSVKFVGTDDQFDFYMKNLFTCKELRIRFPTIIAWLNMLKVVNPLYATVPIHDTPAVEKRVRDLEAQIIEQATLLGATAIGVEKHLGSDIAGVRWHVSDNVDEEHTSEDTLPEAILEPVLITDSTGVDWLPKEDHRQRDLFQQISNLVNPVITSKKTSNCPINEFLENDRLFLGAFPHLFILGQGVPVDSFSSIDIYEHYLNQFTGTMAINSHFMFMLSNQRRRHAAIRSVNARVKNTPTAILRFSEIVNSEEFKQKVQEAILNPMGKAAQYVINITEPYIQMCGKKVPYSPMERQNSMGELIAMTQRYGVPSVFQTISLDDIHHPMVIRLAFPSESNISFPAKCGEFLDTLRNGDVTYDQKSVSDFSLQKLVTGNSFASAI